MDPSLMLPRTIVGAIGNAVSFGLFLSPLPTITRYHKVKSTEGFHPNFYLAAIMNCCLWILYGSPAIHPNSTLVWTINAVGLVCNVFYTAEFWWYTTKKWRRVILLVLLVEGIFLALIAGLTIYFVPDHKTRSTIIGTICIVFNIILYGSPLSVLVKVFKTKSVEYLPFWVSLAGFSNGLLWTAYGLMPIDVNLLVGNGTGSCLCGFQLILHFIWGHPIDNFCGPFVTVWNFVSGKKAPEDGEKKVVEMKNVEVEK